MRRTDANGLTQVGNWQPACDLKDLADAGTGINFALLISNGAEPPTARRRATGYYENPDKELAPSPPGYGVQSTPSRTISSKSISASFPPT